MPKSDANMSMSKRHAENEIVDRSDARTSLGVALFCIAVLCGKINIPIIPESLFTEIRLFSTTISAILLVPIITTTRLTYQQTLLVVGFGIFVAFLMVRGPFDGSTKTIHKQIDVIYISAQCFLAYIVASHGRANIVAVSVVTLSSAYFCLALGSYIFFPEANYGLGWGPPRTAITFNRIMFTGFVCAAALASGGRYPQILVVLSSVFFLATIGSIQKSALVGTLACSIMIVIGLTWLRLWKPLVLALAISIIVAPLALYIFGDKIFGRVSDSLSLSPGETDIPLAPYPGLPSDLGPDYQVLPDGTTHQIATGPTRLAVQFSYCLYERRSFQLNVFDLACRQGNFEDRSDRLVLWSEAIRNFVSAPIFGIGLGKYESANIRIVDLIPDVYYYPHNLVLEIMAEGGSIGFMFFSFALIIVALSLLNSRAPTLVRVFVVAYAFYMLIAAMIGGDFYDSRLIWVSGFLMSFWALPLREGRDGPLT